MFLLLHSFFVEGVSAAAAVEVEAVQGVQDVKGLLEMIGFSVVWYNLGNLITNRWNSVKGNHDNPVSGNHPGIEY